MGSTLHYTPDVIPLLFCVLYGTVSVVGQTHTQPVVLSGSNMQEAIPQANVCHTETTCLIVELMNNKSSSIIFVKFLFFYISLCGTLGTVLFTPIQQKHHPIKCHHHRFCLMLNTMQNISSEDIFENQRCLWLCSFLTAEFDQCSWQNSGEVYKHFNCCDYSWISHRFHILLNINTQRDMATSLEKIFPVDHKR